MNRWFIVIAALVIAAMVGGIAYNIGVQQGIAHSGKVIAAPAAGPYPYPYPYYGWHPWGFGFFFFPFFFFALWFLLFRGIFWRGRGWHRYGYGCGPVPRESENDSDRR